MVRTFELLAPAKDIECAREAILHGADAVYIGAPKYGARAAAGNSLEDLAELIAFAHRYYVKIYITVNTLLYESELKEAEQLIWNLWRIGADALIVQDTAITGMNLPPIPLHASTQMDNRSAEKVQFLRDAGFEQVVLARELSLEQIRSISDALDADRKNDRKPPVRLEAFIHGALCVSYSGQCYLSYALSGRSANRGCCAQYCRMAYDLVDAKGRELIHRKHLLSLKDLHRSEEDLEALMEAGISSFKIEGRLKDVTYCKNVTAWYRQRLDAILARHPDWKRSSSGRETFSFAPDPAKSFNRSFTDYFLHGRSDEMSNFDTPKSMGEEVGFVRAQKPNHFVFIGKEPLHNGDGLSYFDEQGVFCGFRVNRVEGNLIYPAEAKLRLKTGIKLYRTANQAFDKVLEKPSAKRVIEVSVECRELPWGFSLQMDDGEGHRAAVTFPSDKPAALKPQTEQVRALLSKAADALFQVSSCTVLWDKEYFLPASVWTAQRNRLYERFRAVRQMARPTSEAVLRATDHPFPYPGKLSYKGNVLNSLAETFYRRHGIASCEAALEALTSPENTSQPASLPQAAELMRCRYCLKHALGACPKTDGHTRLDEPLFLRLNGELLPLHFDCKNCEMTVGAPAARPGQGR